MKDSVVLYMSPFFLHGSYLAVASAGTDKTSTVDKSKEVYQEAIDIAN